MSREMLIKNSVCCSVNLLHKALVILEAVDGAVVMVVSEQLESHHFIFRPLHFRWWLHLLQILSKQWLLENDCPEY